MVGVSKTNSGFAGLGTASHQDVQAGDHGGIKETASCANATIHDGFWTNWPDETEVPFARQGPTPEEPGHSCAPVSSPVTDPGRLEAV